MKKTLTSLIATAVMFGVVQAAVVRLAPDFTYQGAKHATLRSLRGQPVVLIVAPSAKDGNFRKQAKRLKEIYQDFASRSVIFVAAFQKNEGTIPSDVPFVIADNAAKISADYQVQGNFAIIVIGTDGNVDMQTSKLVPATRLRDVVINSYPAQAVQRSAKNQ
jgi:hypothetical protein